MDVPAYLDLHWSHTRKKAYIWRKGLMIHIVSFIKHCGLETINNNDTQIEIYYSRIDFSQ
jgi:hypothetical protein